MWTYHAHGVHPTTPAHGAATHSHSAARFHRFNRFAFIGGYGGYGYYDDCWRRVWTAYGPQLVNVCTDYGYDYGY